MLDPVKILQDSRTEATAAVNFGDWNFVFDLMCNAIGHLIGTQPFVEITHEGRAEPQPVAAILNESEDIESAVVQQMEQEYF